LTADGVYLSFSLSACQAARVLGLKVFFFLRNLLLKHDLYFYIYGMYGG